MSLWVEELQSDLNEFARAEAADAFDGLRRNLRSVNELIQRVLNANIQPAGIGSAFHPECRSFALWPLVQRLLVDLRSIFLETKCRKQIVEAHGGTVHAETTHGAGATFAFTIPTPGEN